MIQKGKFIFIVREEEALPKILDTYSHHQ